jgi:RNA polymerase sigma-70 factor (ECF subfamily)
VKGSPGSSLETLAGRAAGGDREAFGQLAVAVGPRVHAVAWRLLADSQLAADAVQEFLIKLLKVLPGYDTARPFWPWARRVAAALAVDMLRREQAWRQVPLDSVLEVAGSDAGAPDRQLDAARQVDRVQQAARGLPPRQRAVFMLRDVEQWTVDEIAEELKMQPGTVRVHLARARARLREVLTADQGDGHGEL